MVKKRPFNGQNKFLHKLAKNDIQRRNAFDHLWAIFRGLLMAIKIFQWQFNGQKIESISTRVLIALNPCWSRDESIFRVMILVTCRYMCIFQKSYALLGQTFSKFKMRVSFLEPTFFGTFFCQKYGKNSADSQ